jgi:hypothetical protein
MKRFLLLSFMLCFAVIYGKAQVLLSEDFSGTAFPPSGWTIDAHGGNWSRVTTANAGSVAPEAFMNWSPQFNGASRFISPSVDLTGIQSVIISYNHYFDDYSGGTKIGVATRNGSTGAWTTVWEKSMTADFGPENRVLLVNNANTNKPDFQFCIYFSGNSYNIDGYTIDNVELSVAFDINAGLSTISTPLFSDGHVKIEGNVVNKGANAITSVKLAYDIDGELADTTEITGLNASTGDIIPYSFDPELALTPGDKNVVVRILSVNGGADMFAGDDSLTKTLHVASKGVARLPLFEEFTSSTCAPCASFNNSTFNPFIATNGDKISLIKYQMNWPGSGDPYYTAEGGVRRGLYAVNAVPMLFCDGGNVATSSTGVNNAFNNSLDNPAFMEMQAFHTIEGNNVNVHLYITPYLYAQLSVFVAVVEKKTTQNVASNGETEFHNVMMKMVPDAEGTLVDMVDGNLMELNFTQDMSGTFVEEMSDLSVICFVQDKNSRLLFQSVVSTESAVGVNNLNSKEISIYPNPTSGKLFILNGQDVNRVEIYSMSGEQIKSIDCTNLSTLDISSLSKGLYVLRLHDLNGNVITKKVTIL